MIWLFRILLFFVPIVLFPTTSELFEFNKIVLVYLLTSLIALFWVIKMIQQKKFIFRRTILDIPLLVFLGSQIISTIFSMDIRTSLLGYYSRFNGGLLSLICYALLYWAWVSTINKRETLQSIKYLFASALLVGAYAILEHFGIDKNIWVQDVQTRVFSTLGQPNWLAAWVVAIIPITWALIFNKKIIQKSWYWICVYLVLLLTLIYTKSRSGFLAFGMTILIFFPFFIFKIKDSLKNCLLVGAITLFIVILAGTPWTPSFYKFIRKESVTATPLTDLPSSQMGGTESGDIRKIVWKGAINIWKHHPIIGTGVETFAYAYYKERPPEHNLVSEWDFLYNKAHNEYLNFMATTGTFGIVSYLVLIGFSLYFILKNKGEFSLAILAGYISILVTNFFGFSVTPINILFFLFPAFALTLAGRDEDKLLKSKTAQRLKLTVILLCLFEAFLIYHISRYWYADILLNKGKNLYDEGNYFAARQTLVKGVNLSPREAIFWDRLSQSGGGLALSYLSEKDVQNGKEFANQALLESQQALALSPNNINIRKDQISLLLKLAIYNKTLTDEAIRATNSVIEMAPTDPSLYYTMGLIYMKKGENQKAVDWFVKTITMKPNYKNARLAYAYLLTDMGQNKAAVEELKYVLEKIDPNDESAQQELNKLTQ